MLWDDGTLGKDWNKFTDYANPDFQEIFKVSIKQGDQNNELTPAQELLQSVAQQYMAGYSTSESKLSELKDGKFKNGFKFTVSKTAEAYETLQRKKNAILVALSFAKNKGGGEASRQSLIDYLD
jgi:hypothetical protein